MTITQEVVNKIIKKLIAGESYRSEVVALIDADFLQHTIDFFKEVIKAKLANEKVNLDWYKKVFLSEDLPSKNIAHNSGLNMKTIRNEFNSARREIVIDASIEHYEIIHDSIKELIDGNEGLDLTLTLKFKDVSVDLTINETLIVINALAVKRAAIRGGYWSSAGKRAEKPLMLVLCDLYRVREKNYELKVKRQTLKKGEFEREIDFYLVDNAGERFKCEVKLMGGGNPESADAFYARDSKVFIADKLSQKNKDQLNSNDVLWVELRDKNGFEGFEDVLKRFNIPYQKKFNEKNLIELVNIALSKIQK